MAEVNETVTLFCNILSTIIILLCFFLKLPQIMKILNQKSVTGLSLSSELLSLGSYSVTASYNYFNGYSLMSYLEYPVIIGQELILVYLYLLYGRDSTLKTKSLTVSLCSAYGLFAILISNGIIPAKVLDFCIVLCTPISLSSKVVQLEKIWRIKSADSVSSSTWFLSTFTNSARLYTVTMDSADKILMTNLTLSSLLAVSIMLSAQHFQNISGDKLKKQS